MSEYTGLGLRESIHLCLQQRLRRLGQVLHLRRAEVKGDVTITSSQEVAIAADNSPQVSDLHSTSLGFSAWGCLFWQQGHLSLTAAQRGAKVSVLPRTLPSISKKTLHWIPAPQLGQLWALFYSCHVFHLQLEPFCVCAYVYVCVCVWQGRSLW